MTTRTLPSTGPASDPVTTTALLWDMEQRFWTEGADSARRMSSKDAICVFPEPSGILHGSDLWRDRAVAQRWRSIEMTDRITILSGPAATLAYRARADRSDVVGHVALCISTYALSGATWLRVTHQETPVPEGAASPG